MQPASSSDLSKLGVVFVLVAGPSPWWGRERGDVIDWFAALGMIWCAVPITALAWSGGASGAGWGVAMLAGSAVFLLPVVTWLARSRWLFGTNVYAVIPVRLAGAIAIAVGLDRGPGPFVLGVALFGFLAGCDATLSLHAVGLRLSPLAAVARFARSALNVGIVLGLAVSVAIGGSAALRAAAELYVSLWLVAIIMLTMVSTLQIGDDLVQRGRRADAEAVRAQERLERAHWIHDDVCADLRVVRIQLDAHAIELDQVGVALSDLDHRMRLRQLDEQMASGRVRLAEVVQPFARKLQDRGITLTDMPRFDAVNVELRGEVATSARRALAVLTSNALNAGATAVGIRASAGDGWVTIEVDDDAGGFRLEDVPAGRGLDRLRHDVGSLAVRPAPGGSVVTVRIANAADRPAGGRATRHDAV